MGYKVMRPKLRINTGVKASAVYTIASFITKGISIITIPIFTRIMSTEQIGIVTTYNSWVSILSVFACLGFTTGSFSVAMHEYKEERNQYESAALTLTSLISILFAIVYSLAFEKINKMLGMPWQLVVLMLIGFFIHPATEFWMARQRFEYKYKLCALVSVLSAVVSSALAIITVVLFNKHGLGQIAIGRLYATYIVYDVVALGIYIYIMKQGKTFFNFKYWKFGITLSVPLMVHALAKHILDVSDKIMIQNICGNSQVGIYGTLYSLSSLSLIFWTAINVSLVPFMFSCMDNKATEKSRLNKVLFPVMLLYGAVAILMAFISPEIVSIIATDEYYEAIYMMPPVAAGIYYTSLYNIMGNVLLYHKKTKHIMLATIVASVLNVTTNYVFIHMFGYIAAAYTTLGCNIVLAISQYCMAKRIHGDLPFQEKGLWILSAVVCLIVLSCNFLYRVANIRYLIIVMFCLILIIKRKYIINIVKQIMK